MKLIPEETAANRSSTENIFLFFQFNKTSKILFCRNRRSLENKGESSDRSIDFDLRVRMHGRRVGKTMLIIPLGTHAWKKGWKDNANHPFRDNILSKFKIQNLRSSRTLLLLKKCIISMISDNVRCHFNFVINSIEKML